MEKDELVHKINFTRNELTARMSILADNLQRTSDAVRHANTLKELSLAFREAGAIYNCEIDNLCGRLGAYVRVLEEVDPAAKLDKRT